jgi:hypothetical protein
MGGNIKVNVKEISCDDKDWILLTQDSGQWLTHENIFRFHKRQAIS